MERLYRSTNGQARSERTAQRLRDATLACLKSEGLAGTTSRAITARAGVGLGSVTYHFGSKDDLVAEVLVDAVRAWLAPALEAMRSDADPATRTIRAVAAVRVSFEAAKDLLPVYFEALVRSPRVGPLQSRVSALVDEVRRFMAAQLHEMRDTGAVPAWVDPSAMATLQIALADGLALHAALDPDSVDPDAVARQMAMLLLVAGSHVSVPAANGAV